MSRRNGKVVHRPRVTFFIELVLSIGNLIVYLEVSDQVLCLLLVM